jgi:hypothetical protein
VNAPVKELRISIRLFQELPADDAGVRGARRAALESAVLKLWEAGHVSTRQAAKRLGLSYYDYLDLLEAKGLHVMRQEPREDVVSEVMEKRRAEGRKRS